MMTSPTASDASSSQELVFDTHLKKIDAFIKAMISNAAIHPAYEDTNINLIVLKSYSQTLKAQELPRDIFALKASTKKLLERMIIDKKSVDFILAVASYLDHELTLMECFISKIEEVRLNYLKEKNGKGWHVAATNLGPILSDCRGKKDLTLLKTTLLEFCHSQLIYLGRHSKTFKPNLEAIANAIPTNESVLAASATLSLEAVKSLRAHLESLNAQMAFVKERCVTLDLDKEQTTLSLTAELNMVAQQLSTLRIEKEQMADELRTAKAAMEESKKSVFGNIFNFGDDNPPAPPIVHAQKAAAKASAPAPAKPQAKAGAAPTPLRMEDDKRRAANAPGGK